ncbi:MAG: 3-hydroxyacyl-CoA dehydrogenase NAD-binding domain-containing protein [Deltaproteobacteria bacterium]|nr:3-hydroxyacyl-CoA dehydrogenase NAD-binding domain-containing protein [Deltaproteobacteria bacterium]
MDVKKVMVVGSGTMGAGIVQVAAQAGYSVVMKLHQNMERGMKIINGSLDNQVKKERITADDKNKILSRIKLTTAWEDAADVDFIIESIAENFDAKKEAFEKLDNICRPEVIFATNTSSIPITKLATTVKRPQNFIGTHFFNPVPAMRLVEIVRGLKTSMETVLTAEKVIHSMKKDTVRVKDVPGFLVNRINQALRNEAYNCLTEGVASVEDIDKAARMALGHPMGPFEVADLVGLDIGLEVLRGLFESYKDIKWRPNMILEQLVESGDLGKKSGRGWYDYSSGEKKPRSDVKF